MTVDGLVPGAVTVEDVWRVRLDWRALGHAASCLPGELEAAADELREASAVVRRGQELLTAVLERVEVPVAWRADGRLTFFPHDPADLAAIDAAEAAAAQIHARLAEALARHRARLRALT